MPASRLSKRRNYIAALWCTASLFVFALFINTGYPLKIIAVGALILSAFFISRIVKMQKNFRCAFGLENIHPVLIVWVIIGALFGIALACFYRFWFGIELFPNHLYPFAIVSAAIGITEELIFRGVIQGQVRGLGKMGSIVFAAMAHAIYKTGMFVFSDVNDSIDLSALVFLTFFVGIALGGLRELSKNVIPAVIAHSIFDIMVYGGLTMAPWWVWN